jgi:hypothetical protein
VLMVIFGAGASYDSSPDWPPAGPLPEDRPPLANELFHQRYSRFRDEYPQFLGLLAELVPKRDRSIEQVLQRLQQDAATNPSRTQQLTAIRYYLRALFTSLTESWLRRIGGHTTYNNLIEQIEQHRGADEPVCIVTFNYDTLLEAALRKQLGMQFDNVPDYVSHRHYKVFKLHGSTNWGRLVEGGPARLGSWQPTEIIRDRNSFRVSDTYAMFDQQPAWPLFPAIAIPVTDKQAFECPAEHVQVLKQLIPKVTKILTVGWRGTESHFLNLLRGHGPVSILCVGGTEPDAEITFNSLRAVSLSVVTSVPLAGFSDSVGDRRLDGFLAA